MKVLLTGGGGMVGRNVLNHSRARGLEIHAPTRSQVDLRDKAQVRRYMADLKPDVVVHAAGKVGGIQANIAAPYAFLLENLEIGSNVVAAAAECGVDRLINLASSCVYPRNVDGFLHEDMILTGELEPTNEGYAIAKLATLKLCQYASVGATERRFKTMVPCNLYGRWDNFDLESGHLIPAVIHKVHRAKVERRPTVEIWGDGQARREFMYCGDLADAVLEALVRFESAPQLMNIGLGRDHTILEYYQAVADVVGWRGEFVFDLAKPAGMRRKLVDVSRQKAWGWAPTTSLADGLAATYEFFLKERQ